MSPVLAKYQTPGQGAQGPNAAVMPKIVTSVDGLPSRPQAVKHDPNAQWDMGFTRTDAAFGSVAAAQGGLKAANDNGLERAEGAQNRLDGFRDFSSDRQQVIEDPSTSPVDKAIAAHEQDIAQVGAAAQQKEVDAQLGRVGAVPGPVRSAASADFWGSVQRRLAPNGEELSTFANKVAKPFVRGIPVAGLVLTAAQTEQAITVDHHSVGRSIAEGVGSTLGGAIFGVGAALLAGPETLGVGSIPAGVAAGAAGSYWGTKAADWLTDRFDDHEGIPH